MSSPRNIIVVMTDQQRPDFMAGEGFPLDTMPRVDALEGCVPGDLLRSQYVREAVEVRLDRGSRRWAWIYFYARPLGAAVWIPGGDYRAHAARRLSPVGPARREYGREYI